METERKILAIDSSGLVASAAVLTEENLIAEYTVNFKKTHSQTLLPMIDEIVRMTEVNLKELDAIAVAAGPGSFTGLRIGSATAKGLGLALGLPIIGVSTVEALAYNLFGTERLICPMMDAKRGQIYTGLYTFQEGAMVTLIEHDVIAAEQMIERINQIAKPVIYLGDGVPVYRELIKCKTEVPYTFAPAHLSKQRAGAVGALAFEYYKQGRTESAAEHAPVYLRVSQAERELLEKQKQQ